jgi:hypothetical protein
MRRLAAAGEPTLMRSALVVVALALAVMSGRAGAHGGRVQVAKAPAGPYLVSVWTSPDPPRVGALDVSLAVMEPRTERALLDATARVTLLPSGGPGPGFVRELRSGADGNPLLYHAVLEIPHQGTWHAIVRVEGSAGHGEIGFELAVEPAPSLLWTLAPGVGVLVALVAWLAASRR